jgi:recombination associated protein RdgC
MFKNISAFRLPADFTWLDDIGTLHDVLCQFPLREPGPLELETRGFLSPWRSGDLLSAHTTGAGGAFLVRLGQMSRLLPASVLRDAMDARVADHQAKTGRKPGKRLRNDFREAALSELLPRAFIQRRVVDAMWLPAHRLLIIDATSDTTAEAVASALREALGSFPARPLAADASLTLLMSEWLVSNTLPDDFEFGDSAELKDPSDKTTVVRARHHDLSADEVREHARCGKQVTQLGLTYDGRISFVLDAKLKLRGISFADGILEDLDDKAAEGADADQMFEAELFLQAEELTRLFTALDGVLRFVD